MLEPMKMTKAATAVPILQRIKRSFIVADTGLLRSNARGMGTVHAGAP